MTEDGAYHTGLDRYIVEIKGDTPFVLVDNHNAVAHTWGVAWCMNLIEPGITLAHVDQHSDLWSNDQTAPSLHREGLDDWWEYAYRQCTVANYISPLYAKGYIREVVRIE